MSVEVLVSKPAPTIQAAPKGNNNSGSSGSSGNRMKEHLGRPVTHAGGRPSTNAGHHQYQYHPGQQQQQQYHVQLRGNQQQYSNHQQLYGQPQQQQQHPSTADPAVRSTPDINGHSQHAASSSDVQHFDHTHIIYDNTTDTTYLRGRLLGKVSVLCSFIMLPHLRTCL
ncbi:hypothetical protein PoB_003985000 [Plakobranchus ocellatus]|uniref:Uncharacterized protein n=1 Tax=Plakobranchus ocellatus TaxID=259542 RepID=A0AAV4AY94_9GAST|nr:hypothetical protein PoB_003985000 [Plakobranchus ocellatus]